MRSYALVFLVLAAMLAVVGFFFPAHRRTAYVAAGASFIFSLTLFGIDCAISCVRTGELYVPKR